MHEANDGNGSTAVARDHAVGLLIHVAETTDHVAELAGCVAEQVPRLRAPFRTITIGRSEQARPNSVSSTNRSRCPSGSEICTNKLPGAFRLLIQRLLDRLHNDVRENKPPIASAIMQ